MKKFMIQLFSKPQNKDFYTISYYYFFIIFYPITVIDGLFNLLTNADYQNIKVFISFIFFLIFAPLVFRFSTIVSFFREREVNTNNTAPKQIPFIKVIMGPMGNKKVDQIVYWIMVTLYGTLIFQLITECDFKDIFEVLSSLLLSLIVLTFFRTLYKRYFLV